MGQGIGESSLFPGGDIPFSSFVKLDPSNTGYALVAGANDVVFGISGPETRRIALDSYDTDLAGKSGDPALKIYGVGSTMVPLRLGGTVAHGDPIISDASGKGVKSTTNKDKVAAIARASGVAGEIIPVDVVRHVANI